MWNYDISPSNGSDSYFNLSGDINFDSSAGSNVRCVSFTHYATEPQLLRLGSALGKADAQCSARRHRRIRQPG